MEPAGQRSAGAASPYQILGHLATGGMAELYLARPAGSDAGTRPVVLKRIMADYSRNPRFVAMFLDEARLASQLVHPNIARVLDVGRVGASYYFTMEYVHGANVRDLLQRVAGLRRRVPLAQALAIVIGAAAGLHHAHEQRGPDGRPLEIVHRDVSPSNLMVSYDGEVKLLDFGIAKAADRMTETRSGAVKGKVAYMSPEQCTGQPVDRRSDVFSLGIILFELATMTRLFKHASDFETMNHIVNLPVPRPRERRPELARELDDVIVRALARRPEDRFATCGELQAALERFAARAGLAVDAASLGRYLRDVIGLRPVPWSEHDDAHDEPDGGEATTDAAMHDLDPPTGQHRLQGHAPPPPDWEPLASASNEQVEPLAAADVRHGGGDEDDPFAAPTEVVPPGEVLAVMAARAAKEAGDAGDAGDDPFAAPTTVEPFHPELAGAEPAPTTGSEVHVAWSTGVPVPPPRRFGRWWLWAGVVAAGIAIGTVAAKVSRRSRERSAAPSQTVAPAVIDAAEAIDEIDAVDAAPQSLAIPIDASTAVAADSASVVVDAGPAPDASAPAAQPPRPRAPRNPRVTTPPPPPPVKCGDAMGIYPPCE